MYKVDPQVGPTVVEEISLEVPQVSDTLLAGSVMAVALAQVVAIALLKGVRAAKNNKERNLGSFFKFIKGILMELLEMGIVIAAEEKLDGF